MALERAEIRPIIPEGAPIRVWLNPEEYTINQGVNYAQTGVPGLSGPIIQFVNGNLQTLEMELLVDTYDTEEQLSAKQDARELTDQITSLMAPHPETHAPPILLYTWGSLTVRCVLASVSHRFTMFRPDGIPVRARLQVTFNKFTNAELEPREIKRETADYSKQYLVGQNETLSAIAARLYGDPALWRPIALRNGLSDPRRLPMGSMLIVPQLPFVDALTGEVYE